MKKTATSILCVVLLLIIVGHTATHSVSAIEATEAATPSPKQDLKIKMADGLDIVATFYPTTGTDKAPVVLLLHQFEGDRGQWDPIIPDLTGHNYNVLAIDLRGFGNTGGTADWKLAVTDGLALMGWLRNQSSVDPDRVAVIGASIGADLALKVCAADTDCHTAIALSPGLSFPDGMTTDTVKNMTNKAILLIAAQLDRVSSSAVKLLTDVAPVDLTIMSKLYASVRNHGVELLTHPDVSPLILQWLDTYNKK